MERLEIEAASQALLLAFAQVQNLVLAHEIRHGLRCRLRVAAYFANSVRTLEVPNVHQHVNGFVKRHAARVELYVDNDTAGSPKLVFQLKDAMARIGCQAFIEYELFAIKRPAFAKHGVPQQLANG